MENRVELEKLLYLLDATLVDFVYDPNNDHCTGIQSSYNFLNNIAKVYYKIKKNYTSFDKLFIDIYGTEYWE